MLRSPLVFEAHYTLFNLREYLFGKAHISL